MKHIRNKLRLDQFSKIVVTYFTALSSIIALCGLAKDIYLTFTAPEYADWASLYMFIGGIVASSTFGYMLKSGWEKNRTGKDTDAIEDVPEIP